MVPYSLVNLRVGVVGRKTRSTAWLLKALDYYGVETAHFSIDPKKSEGNPFFSELADSDIDFHLLFVSRDFLKTCESDERWKRYLTWHRRRGGLVAVYGRGRKVSIRPELANVYVPIEPETPQKEDSKALHRLLENARFFRQWRTAHS